MRPRRDANGYRQYDDAELRVVHEIRSLLAAGFGLDDIKPFVECLRAGRLERRASESGRSGLLAVGR